MVEVNRRCFLAGSGLAAMGALAQLEEKEFDGGLADVTPPGVPNRATPVLPPGAGSLRGFNLKCVGCQLCVTQCPNHVLRPAGVFSRSFQPEMAFDRGYCRPECTKCGEVCPAGAIRPVTPVRKRHIHCGQAVWHKERCIAFAEGVKCNACERHCPVKAITFVALKPNDPKSVKVPVVDRAKCIGCGACEHLCAARPMPAMQIEGFEVQREVRPMSDADVLAEARKLIAEGKAAVVMVKEGIICAMENGRGIGPLLRLLDDHADEMKGAWIIDKVVGKAAAAICVAGGVKKVHAELMCAPARSLLEEKGVAFTAMKLTENILNREQSGLCPLEQAVKDLSDVGQMLMAIRARLRELGKKIKKES